MERFPCSLDDQAVSSILMSVDELQIVVTQLSADELARFSLWFEEFSAACGTVKLRSTSWPAASTRRVGGPMKTSRRAAARGSLES